MHAQGCAPVAENDWAIIMMLGVIDADPGSAAVIGAEDASHRIRACFHPAAEVHSWVITVFASFAKTKAIDRHDGGVAGNWLTLVINACHREKGLGSINGFIESADAETVQVADIDMAGEAGDGANAGSIIPCAVW